MPPQLTTAEQNHMNIAITLFIIITAGYLLVIGKALFIPLVIAIFVWFLIKTIADTFQRITKIEIPALAYAFSALTMLIAVAIPIKLVSSSVPDVMAAIPTYETNIYNLINAVLTKLNIDQGNLVATIKENLKISTVVSYMATNITNFTSNILLVLIYVAFIFAEQGAIKHKIMHIADGRSQRKHFEKILTHMNERITLYVWVKTQLSLLTAVLSFIIMSIIGIDFAAFWAILIFILNFIPSIGSFIATAFPVLLSLVQFTTPVPALITLTTIGGVQFAIGNLLEPKMMGSSLNLSPLIILLSLFIWGSIWGVTGMFLSIPITVFLMIIFAEFQSTRPIAIILSSKGEL